MGRYTVYMIHKMRSMQTVEAESYEEAIDLAYQQSFENEDWEESDTIYEKVVEA